MEEDQPQGIDPVTSQLYIWNSILSKDFSTSSGEL